MKTYFNETINTIESLRREDEGFLLSFNGEDTEYVRFSQGKVRQPSNQYQAEIALTWIDGQKQAKAQVSLTMDHEEDKALLSSLVESLRQSISVSPEYTLFDYNREPISTCRDVERSFNESTKIVSDIIRSSKEYDLVGLLVMGQQYIGFANHLGQINWAAYDDVTFNWSIFITADKAATGSYSSDTWSLDDFRAKLQDSARDAEIMRRDAITLDPGEYRVYLSPAAVNYLSWFLDCSYGAFRNKSSLLQKLHDGEHTLSPLLTVKDNFDIGMKPDFNGSGFIAKSRTVINQGKTESLFISPTTGAEFNVEHNGAGSYEGFGSLEIESGDLSKNKVLKELGTGIYINNLHYLNPSDRASARITGMTRFACFWVENGEIIAPINVMRFDDTLYRLFGSELEALTQESELSVETIELNQRARGGSKAPGALIKSMRFTL
ncbi:metallopeptidase TldD-related protein [Veronia pacifica]|uniref:Metalloprotease TldD/E C-terminal domain-containing protein n=1 Tax=Veronia pacifica TaxID=1080227 RepID=A0A1C3ESK4_9GAMM|nr:metallopeptidase TldD-related protein [Veronia pacifica]ODA36240.1 hypothetical protein A8L45_01170 [Veronia pacifica]